MSRNLKTAQRWVIKIGSSLLTNNGQGLDLAAIEAWVTQILVLRRQGIELVLVSSGAVAAGMERLGWSTRPTSLHKLQAAASVGQAALIQAYEDFLRRGNVHGSQVLLTHEDLQDRQRYLNARATLRILLEMGVIPIINENDAIASAEIRFGDNDTLAAMVANLLEADLLVILTDQAGLYDRDPRHDPHASLLSEVRAGDPELLRMAGGAGTMLGSGGMITKVRAASRAAQSGAATVIAPGSADNILLRIWSGEDVGTYFRPGVAKLAARKRWLAGQLRPSGTLHLDAGAVRVLREKGSSLLPVGITASEGDFQRGDLVRCVDPEGHEVARGLVNFAQHEVLLRLGKGSKALCALFGDVDEFEIIHRDNLVLSSDQG
ncbi:glutamate 5-kinase [Acidithiobacillus sp. 'AMD consortium']|uniref:Glutamate 5-kinase n=2 Tax=Acidithiobacillus ferridurans TaxID=1232575 RepID=A0A2Z6ILK4_ACIFI|nr:MULTISPECIES: glutamate 5-kinase [Acidithiobacillus]MBU2715369.1 glutamate 5-kinase [Acidithiobacillus ferridurans]MBU2724385.1 glutamate 5-kinase [Acidithiobacillus ferridurans]MBU2726861.1 glutamate 5-kinase [Acidithiobacillus ferridurans]MBU2805026.1 glutamate 5-kinase [Acidithiobacillus ferridurans]QFG77496.1 glutamate 5-kinase [Acidithiobacillus sp. 'AMD consortium']